MAADNMRGWIWGQFRGFRPVRAFVWTLFIGIAIGGAFKNHDLTDREKKWAATFLAIVGSIPWVPLIVDKIAARFSEGLFSDRAAFHQDFHRANKLVAERRRWEAVEEFKNLLREKPDDPDLLFRLAEVYWVELGDVSESLRRYEYLWKRVRDPDKNAFWVNAFPPERALSIAMRLADMHYLCRHVALASQILEDVLAIRGSELQNNRDAVTERIEGLKKLKNVRPITLVLYDIDGTLSTSGGAGGKAVAVAFEETYGKAIDLSKIDFRGRTDISLWREMLSIHGESYSPDDPYLDVFKKKYIQHLQKMLLKSDAKSTLGAPMLLNRLEREPSVALGLLTGNIEIGGRTKLQAVDLNRFFPVGGFGEDGEDRADIARAAIRRSEEFYRVRFTPERIFVVGDAAADIEAARKVGVRSIAVGTGWTPKEDLVALNPDLFLDDFRRATVFLKTIGVSEPLGDRIGPASSDA